MHNHTYQRFLLVCVGITGLLHLVFASYYYPLVSTDGLVFLPPAMSYSKDGSLVNSIYMVSRMLDDGSGSMRFNYYPPLFPIIVGLLNRITNNPILGIAILNTSSIFICTSAYLKFLSRRNLSLNLFNTALIAAFVLSWSTYLNASLSRPESLATLLLSVLLYISITPPKFQFFYSLLLIVLTGFTHIVGGLYAGILFIGVLIINKQKFKYVQSTLGFLFGLALVSWLYPYDIINLFVKIMDHGKIALDMADHSLQVFWNKHVLNPYASFYFIVFLLALGSYVIVAIKKEVYRKMIFWVLQSSLIVVLYYFVFKRTGAIGYLYVIYPIFGFLILSAQAILNSKPFSILSILVLGLASVGFLRRCILFPFFLQMGLSMEEAKVQINSYIDDQSIIHVSTSTFLLMDNHSKLSDGYQDERPFEFKVVQQNFSGTSSAPVINGYNKVADTFIYQPVRVWGIKISNSPPGYQYALYQKEVTQ